LSFFLKLPNAADEAHASGGRFLGGTGTSSQLVLWSLSNTSSLNSASPSLSLSTKVLAVNQYAHFRPRRINPASGSLAHRQHPRRVFCINDTTTTHHRGCWLAGGCCSAARPGAQ